MRIDQINKMFEKAEKSYKSWLLVKQVYDRAEVINEEADLELAVLKYYVLEGSTADAARKLNELGFRTDRGTKLQSSDVSRIISHNSCEDNDLVSVAQFLLDAGRGFIDKLYN